MTKRPNETEDSELNDDRKKRFLQWRLDAGKNLKAPVQAGRKGQKKISYHIQLVEEVVPGKGKYKDLNGLREEVTVYSTDYEEVYAVVVKHFSLPPPPDFPIHRQIFSEENYKLIMLEKLKGPWITKEEPDHLLTKRIVCAFFKPKSIQVNQEEFVVPNEKNKDATNKTSNGILEVPSQGLIPLSRQPVRVTPSKARRVGRNIGAEIAEETAHIRKVQDSDADIGLLPEWEVKFVRGNKIGSGFYRAAYEVTITSGGCILPGQYVMKCPHKAVTDNHKEELDEGNPVKSMCERNVRSQALAQGMLHEFEELTNTVPGFGKPPRYVSAYAMRVGDEHYTLEPKLPPGEFKKYLNSDMDGLLDNSEFGLKAATFAHHNYLKTEKWKEPLLVTDFQGVDNLLTDPEIASPGTHDDTTDKRLFTLGNQGEPAFQNFLRTHECNTYCKMLDLDPLPSVEDSE